MARTTNIRGTQMTTLDEHINALTQQVVSGATGLDEALAAIADWLDAHGYALDRAERDAFRASLDRESTRDNRSLVDSVLRLQVARVMYRQDDEAEAAEPAGEEEANEYIAARDAFNAALRESETGIREARIDIAIANAHHLLGDVRANRAWLDTALARVQPIATLDLVRLAEAVPAMPLPSMGAFRRVGLRLLGVNLDRLSDRNRASFVTLARLQTGQIMVLAHLIGSSFGALRERQRANRAFRVVAHLAIRYGEMPEADAEQALAIAGDLRRAEPEAARVLAKQARAAFAARDDAESVERAEALLEN